VSELAPRPRPDTVFLDRDGTINRKATEGDYVKSPEEFAFLPGAKEALRTLTAQGLRLIVVTNQRGIALGRMSEGDLDEIHRGMLDELEAAGARVAAIYHCPHDRGVCDCRKPEVGMFLRAGSEHPGLVLENSVVIGDGPADMGAADRLGLRRVLIAGEDELMEPTVPVDYRAESLLDAAGWVTTL
jgi:D-glycero-D-manno-heptose 1,7-bisphosphate phosphatase